MRYEYDAEGGFYREVPEPGDAGYADPNASWQEQYRQLGYTPANGYPDPAAYATPEAWTAARNAQYAPADLASITPNAAYNPYAVNLQLQQFAQSGASPEAQFAALQAANADPNYQMSVRPGGIRGFDPGTPNYRAYQWAQQLGLGGGQSPPTAAEVAQMARQRGITDFDPNVWRNFAMQYPQYWNTADAAAIYPETAPDQWSFLGDNFMPALALTGIAVGGAALANPSVFGGTAAASGSAGGELAGEAAGAGGLTSGAVPEAGLGLGVGAGAPAATAPATGGLFGTGLTVGQIAPYASVGSSVIGGASALNGGGGDSGSNVGYTVNPNQYSAPIGPPSPDPTVSNAGNSGAGFAPYVPLAAAGLSAGTNLIGGLITSGAARDAAQTQANAALQANNALLGIYAQNRADLAPYRQVGYGALGDLASLAGQPLSYGAYTPTAPLSPQQYAFNPQQYAFMPPTGQQVLDQDPGFAFRLEQGQKALERQASARGGLLGGGQLRATQRFSQDLASQEYQNAYNRLLTQNQLGYERALQGNELTYGRALAENEAAQQRGLQGYQTNYNVATGLRNLRYGELAGLAGVGQGATGQTAQLGAQTGANVAGNITSGGAALAGGQVGSANALAGGIGGVSNAAGQYLNYSLLSQLLNTRR